MRVERPKQRLVVLTRHGELLRGSWYPAKWGIVHWQQWLEYGQGKACWLERFPVAPRDAAS